MMKKLALDLSSQPNLTRDFLVRDKRVQVYDGLVNDSERKKTSKALLLAKYTSYQIARDDGGQADIYYNLYQARLDVRDFMGTRLYQFVRNTAQSYAINKTLKCTQTFCNAFRYGETVLPHIDHPRSGQGVVSALYCVNDTWEPDWGGELTFFASEGEAAGVVGFKPGRIIVFDGSTLHRPGVPTRNCPRYRLALNVRFEW